jgi:hypothetical protein
MRDGAIRDLGLVRPALLLVFGVGCGEGARRTADTLPAAPPAISAAAPADTGCPKVGDWRVCSVEDRLTRAGLVIERLDEPARYDFLRIDGGRYRVGAGEDEVHVFVYASTADRTADTDALDSLTVSPRGARRSYRVPPLLVTSANLAAIVFTLNERTSERISLALSAGLPQR